MNTGDPSGLRVVLDTNVYFSAFTQPDGVCHRIWQQAIRRRFTLLVSPAIMREVAHVLRDYLRQPSSEVVSILKLIAKVATIVTPTSTVDVVADDDADNRVLECALAGKPT